MYTDTHYICAFMNCTCVPICRTSSRCRISPCSGGVVLSDGDEFAVLKVVGLLQTLWHRFRFVMLSMQLTKLHSHRVFVALRYSEVKPPERMLKVQMSLFMEN